MAVGVTWLAWLGDGPLKISYEILVSDALRVDVTTVESTFD